ncbi:MULTISPECIES: sulfate adenylyltransferase subunit 1 [Aestuariimicrobium]|uniref:sulfate adenylyltransferase subunit 1 n=1 Tax=Aestuariimicrobium TaxID=396388 RepID=UPI0003B78D7D|nr:MULTISPECIES: GTP-binding protein [Aestuariimicrobium]CAI9402763.1 Bifunctional enzyme CysN/CysC [Aestuariimicrobium sp. T2.26MG-19.2B]
MSTSTLLRLATAGSVDDGKSTLVGRLLHDSKSVMADQLEAVERASRDRGLTAADLALLTDGLRAEREQGITIDVAYRYFATAQRSFVLADCPGHVQYTRNTVTGSSTADVVVLLADVRHGVVEQTRRHLAVAALLRVPHVIVAVNKIDLVDYDADKYAAVDASVRQLADQLGVVDVHTIPVSALAGDNVVDESNRTPWYEGPSLLHLLEQLPIEAEELAADRQVRLPVQTVLRPQQAARDPRFVEYRGYAGPVVQGTITVGDPITVLPSGLRSTVTGITIGDREVSRASAPLSVAVELADDIDIARGDVIVGGDQQPVNARDLDATVCWLSERPLRPRARLLLKHLTRTTQVIVDDISGVLDLHSLVAQPAETLGLNDLGRVRLRLANPIVAEPYSTSRRTGAFLLIDPSDGSTLAAGMIREARDPDSAESAERDLEARSQASQDWII